MILYLLSSTLCMGILLLFYHLVLETEKMYTINRGYLIFSLIFSLSIPLIPVGMPDALLPWIQSQNGAEVQSQFYTSLAERDWLNIESDGKVVGSAESGISLPAITKFAFLIYTIVAAALLIRLLRIVHMIQLKAERNQKKLFDNYEIVLLNEHVVPHTFCSTIFLNKDKYLKGEIPEVVLEHELTHAKQKHSFDILFLEFLKIVFWFNPILYLYKKAILMNHEFLADEAVISRGTQISEYQTLLLNSLIKYPSPGLISQFSYKTTKKRVLMMLQTKSKIRAIVKITSLIPLFISLSLLLGCEYTPSEYSEQGMVINELTIEISDSETLNVNSTLMNLSEFEKYLSNLPMKPELTHFEVSPSATTGMVIDVQQLLRTYEIRKINYSTNEEENKKKLDHVTKEFLDAADKYMKMSVENTDSQTLKSEYDEVVKKYKTIQDVEIRNPDSPPPPPLPPSPEKRIENAEHGTGKVETPNPPPALHEQKD